MNNSLISCQFSWKPVLRVQCDPLVIANLIYYDKSSAGQIEKFREMQPTIILQNNNNSHHEDCYNNASMTWKPKNITHDRIPLKPWLPRFPLWWVDLPTPPVCHASLGAYFTSFSFRLRGRKSESMAYSFFFFFLHLHSFLKCSLFCIFPDKKHKRPCRPLISGALLSRAGRITVKSLKHGVGLFIVSQKEKKQIKIGCTFRNVKCTLHCLSAS